jgi:hypothetical protein
MESDDDEKNKDPSSSPHIFVLMNGDVTEMFNDSSISSKQQIRNKKRHHRLAWSLRRLSTFCCIMMTIPKNCE